MTTAADLDTCLGNCLANHLPKQQLLTCENTCETTFMQTVGNSQTTIANGGKVFRDPTGAYVTVNKDGGKVFTPAGG